MFKTKFLNQTVLAVATLAGTTIGVGFFSLPYVARYVGLWVMLFYFIFLSIAVILISIMYGEVTLRTKQNFRLPGYVEKYLGTGWKKISLISGITGLVGANLAYLIIGGGFLYALFNPIFGGGVFCYVFMFFLVGSVLVYSDVKGIARTELLLLAVFFVALLVILFRSLPLIKADYLFNFNSKYLFLPYGAVLFSLSDLVLIPEIKEMLVDSPLKLKKVVIISVTLAAVSYLIFTLAVLGLTGPLTSTDAISGLKFVLDNGLISLILVLGILTTFTSFITLTLTLKKIFWYDMRLKKNTSWVLACFLPLALYLLGIKDFIMVVSLTGGALLGIDIALIVFTYLKAKRHGDQIPAYELHLPNAVTYSLLFVFLLGIFYQIWYFAF